MSTHLSRRMPLLAAVLFFSVPSLGAQVAADPSGHWEGTIQVPEREVRIEVDLAKSAKGDLAGTFGNPARNVAGLPLANVAVDGKSVRFVLKVNSGGGTFEGVLGDDGKSMSGKFNTAEGGYSIPFTLTRTGDAKIEPPAKSASIGKELEGTWNGALDVDGKHVRLVLKMANQPDGTATGSLLSVDGGGLEVPIIMTQKGSTLTLAIKAVGSSYAGTLNTEGTALVGTYTEGTVVLPLTFQRAAAAEGKK
jgi:hypothetical protein